MRRPNILWFLLDTVRPDRLASCGARDARRLFVDDVLDRGTHLTQVIAAGPYSMLALNAIFTSLYGTTNGVDGAYKTTPEDLDPDVITMTDVLKRQGYTTLAYAGSAFEPMEPPLGFDVYRLAPRLDDRIVEEYFAAPEPRFLSLSFQRVHDECCARPWEMTPATYDAVLAELSAELEHFFRRLVRPGDVAVVYSDHGVRLRERVQTDRRFRPEEEPTTGVYLTEGTIRTFCAFVHDGLFPARKVDRMVRSIDLAPTLLDALGFPPLGGQGVSLWPHLRAGADPPARVAYSETGGRWFSPWRPNVRAARTERWKLVRHDALGDALYDLQSDPGETENLVGRGLPDEAAMRAKLARQLELVARPARAFYDEHGVDFASYLAARPPLPAIPSFARLMTPYERMCQALEAEQLAPVQEHAARFEALAAAEAARAPDQAIRAACAAAREIAAGFRACRDVPAARRLFGDLSRLVVAFVAAQPTFWPSLVVYESAEAPGYRRWLQKRNDDRIVNPYAASGSAAVAEVGFEP